MPFSLSFALHLLLLLLSHCTPCTPTPCRWVYPIVPDNNFLGENTSYKYQRRGLYKEDDVTIAVRSHSSASSSSPASEKLHARRGHSHRTRH
jgi:hypothetical protein